MYAKKNVEKATRFPNYLEEMRIKGKNMKKNLDFYSEKQSKNQKKITKGIIT